LLGSLNFTTAPAEVIQGRIYTTKYNQRAHLVLVLNMLFKYIGRKERFKIGKNRAASAAVKHLTLVEMLKVADNIKDPVVRLAALTAFGTGCRVGELFPISTFNDTAHTVRIISQIDIFGVERHIKTFDGRVAVVIHELLAHVREWIALPVAERMKIRNYRLSSIMKAACRKTFPGDSSKECHFYDLRHSYAIHFLSLGATVDIIAAALGNSPEVCRKHYTGFVLTEGGIALMNALQRKAG
jgi:integrase